MNITFEQFVKQIKDIETIHEYENGLREVSMKINRNSEKQSELYFPTLEQNVVDLLELLTNDSSSWISYWIFELDLGTKFELGMVIDSDGSKVPLKTVEDLWNFLEKNNKSNSEIPSSATHTG